MEHQTNRKKTWIVSSRKDFREMKCVGWLIHDKPEIGCSNHMTQRSKNHVMRHDYLTAHHIIPITSHLASVTNIADLTIMAGGSGFATRLAGCSISGLGTVSFSLYCFMCFHYNYRPVKKTGICSIYTWKQVVSISPLPEVQLTCPKPRKKSLISTLSLRHSRMNMLHR